MLKLRDILGAVAIIGELQSDDKKGVLVEFSRLAASLTNLGEDAVLEVLLNREKLGSTAVGHGVAIPHGKVSGLNNIVALFGRSRQGVDFQAHDHIPSQIFFVILAPETVIGNYLHVLARLSRLMKDERTRQTILKCETKILYQTLIAEDDKL